MTRRIPWWLWIPAAVGALLIVVPPLALLGKVRWAQFGSQLFSSDSLDALRVSVTTSAISTVLCLVLGIPLALVFASSDHPALRVLRGVVLLPLVLPPVVAGIALLYTFGRFGLLGNVLQHGGIEIGFTATAVVLSQTFVALPFLVLSVEGAVRTANAGYADIAATLGASPTRVLRTITVPLIRPGILAGAVLSFARALGEFGATITFAGNRPGVTTTVPVEIYVQSINDPQDALPLSVVLMAFALVVVIAVQARNQRVAQ